MFLGVPRRHGTNGPTPIMRTMTNSIGPFTRLKYGSPTVIDSSSNTSAITGYTVPHSVTKATIRKSKFCNIKKLSRDSIDSSRSLLFKLSIRHANATRDPSNVDTIKAKKIHPMADCANE